MTFQRGKTNVFFGGEGGGRGERGTRERKRDGGIRNRSICRSREEDCFEMLSEGYGGSIRLLVFFLLFFFFFSFF